MKIEDISNCTGCSACASICPKNAIKMNPNLEGFLYPLIDHTKCVSCGLCERTCPAISPLERKNNVIEEIAAYHRNEKIRMRSSSGGIFTVFAEYVINNGGVVFGAKYNNDFSVSHGWVSKVEDLDIFRGSKYIQSSIEDSYKDCLSFLEKEKIVLFTGVPCQIQGLKKFLGKNYDNLITLDLICHGVPSPLVWQKYIDLCLKKNGATHHDLLKTSFRRKDYGWKKFSLAFTFANANEYIEPQTTGKYMLTFNKNIMQRSSCYDCPAKGNYIISDITVGDFWGIQEYCPEFDDDKGCSILFLNSEKGKNLFDKLSSMLVIKKIENYDVLKFNTQLLRSLPMNNKRGEFYKEFLANGFENAYKKYIRDKWYTSIYKKSRHFVGSFLRKIGVKK